MWGKPTTQAQWKMAAKDIIIAKLKWTHTGIYHTYLWDMGTCCSGFFIPVVPADYPVFFLPSGLLENCQQLSACSGAHLTFIYAKMWNHLWNLPSTHSLHIHVHIHIHIHGHPQRPSKGTQFRKGSRSTPRWMLPTTRWWTIEKNCGPWIKAFFLFLSLPPSHGRNVARKKSLHKWMAFSFFFIFHFELFLLRKSGC